MPLSELNLAVVLIVDNVVYCVILSLNIKLDGLDCRSLLA